MADATGEITRLLDEIQAGDKAAEDRLMQVVYPKLRRIAAHYLRQERVGHTLQATALVNEAYMQLLGQAGVNMRSRTHFFAAAAQSMRRILIDYARTRNAMKREGHRQRVELTDVLAMSDDRLDEILAVDQALTRLAEREPRQSRVVELRFFGGLSRDEVAEVLGIAPRTVERDWNFARAWLHGELGRGASG